MSPTTSITVIMVAMFAAVAALGVASSFSAGCPAANTETGSATVLRGRP